MIATPQRSKEELSEIEADLTSRIACIRDQLKQDSDEEAAAAGGSAQSEPEGRNNWRHVP